MASLNMNDYSGLDELKESLLDYVAKYNQTEHQSLHGETPMDRFFSESNRIFRFDEDRIDKTFLLEEERKVSADNVIIIDGKEYEVNYSYSNQKLLIRYSPDLKRVYSVNRKTGEMEELHLLDKVKNASGHRKSFRLSQEGEKK